MQGRCRRANILPMSHEKREKILRLLADAPFFRGLSEEELVAALNSSTRKRVEKGSFYFHQGEEASKFYLLTGGRVRLTQINAEGHQVIMTHLGTGDGLGIIVALSKMKYPVSAEVVSGSTALVWSAERIFELMEHYPRLSLNGLKLVARRFSSLQERYRELATERVERRVARALIRLARQAGVTVDGGVLLDLPLSRQDLAEMTGTTLFTVSRICSRWEQGALISTSREKMVIRDKQQLTAIAEDLPQVWPVSQ